jgi:hypothetical protein
MVELALVLPLLVLLLLTAVDLGMVLWEYQIVQAAAREGARFSALQRNWIDPRNPIATDTAIKQRVLDYLLEEGITTVTAGDITVNQRFPIPAGAVTPFGSEVIVTYNRALLVPGAGLLPFATITLTGRGVFRNFY